MNIHQLSVNYLHDQDRILVRVNTSAGEELRLWFTRRLTLGLWPMLTKIVTDLTAAVQTKATAAVALDAPARQMLAEFKKEEVLRKSDFQTPYKEHAASFPLGHEPLLVTELSLTPQPSGQLQMRFAEKPAALADGTNPAAPRGFQMSLEQPLIHGFVALLGKALEAAQWLPAEQLAAPQQAAAAPQYLN